MRRLFSLCLMGMGLLTVISAVAFWQYNQKVQNPSPAPIPEVVADLPLTEAYVAEKAITEFNRLHGADFPLISGAVGMYGRDPSVTIWVAGAPFQSIAKRLLVAMHDKIASTSGRSPFLPIGERPDGTRTIYELEGMGQQHFYFQSGKLIVWLAVDPDRAEEVLAQVLMFYP